MKSLIFAIMTMGAIPAVASAHHGFDLSIGFGAIDFGYSHYSVDCDRPVCGGYTYTTVYTAPACSAPVCVAPPVVYQQAPVYVPPVVTVVQQPVVVYSPPVYYAPQPRVYYPNAYYGGYYYRGYCR